MVPGRLLGGHIVSLRCRGALAGVLGGRLGGFYWRALFDCRAAGARSFAALTVSAEIAAAVSLADRRASGLQPEIALVERNEERIGWRDNPRAELDVDAAV